MPDAKTPLQNLVVAAAVFDALDQLIVIDTQEPRASRVESATKVRLIIGRQLPLCVLSNLVEHASDINNTADF
jgi:hypothetical protein